MSTKVKLPPAQEVIDAWVAAGLGTQGVDFYGRPSCWVELPGPVPGVCAHINLLYPYREYTLSYVLHTSSATWRDFGHPVKSTSKDPRKLWSRLFPQGTQAAFDEAQKHLDRVAGAAARTAALCAQIEKWFSVKVTPNRLDSGFRCDGRQMAVRLAVADYSDRPYDLSIRTEDADVVESLLAFVRGKAEIVPADKLIPNIDACADDDDLRRLEEAFERLAKYTRLQRRARSWRATGEVNLALRVEQEADDEYSTLPDWARW